MKNNTLFKLFIIFICAILLRLWFLDKPEGLWNDEYVAWYIASKKGFTVFIAEMLKNCHTPLYYLYLKIWMFFFNDSDISLRISSVIPSLFSIITIYFAGKELKDRATGFLCALITTFSSYCIYFAQEVRLYSLLFLFSSLIALYFIRFLKEKTKFNFIMFIIFNALLCALHTLGILYSISVILSAFLYIYKENENYNNKLQNIIKMIKYLLPFFLIIVIILPFLVTIAFSQSLSQFWSNFSITKIILTFTDYFSPIISNISNSPDSFSSYIYNNKTGINYVFIIFAICPSIIILTAIINSQLQHNKYVRYLLCSPLIFIASIVILALIGKMIFLSKYVSEIYPTLILCASYGFLSLKNKKIKKILICIYFALNMIFLFGSDNSTPKQGRSEGHLAVVKLLEYSRLKPGDIVLLTYYDVDKFERYLQDKNLYKFYSINKFNFNYILFNNPNYYQTIHAGKVIYKQFFYEFPNSIIKNYIINHFNCNTKKGDRIGIVFLNTVSFLSEQNIKDILKNDKEYKKTSFIFLIFSSLKNNLIESMKYNYEIDSITTSGEWTLIVFERTN